MARQPVSVCIITKNEEQHLPDCLRSVAWADEIVVVDSRSTDRTREIARKAGARVIERDFDGYGRQKNFAKDEARHMWVLSLDADERVSPEMKASVLRALENPGPYDGFLVSRRNLQLGRWIRHSGLYPDRKLRLFRRDRTEWSPPLVHELAHVKGPVGRLRGDLLHESYSDISNHVLRIDRLTSAVARQKHEAGERFRVHRLLLRPPAAFFRLYVFRLGFLDGMAGLVIAVKTSFDVFLKYAKLWELQRTDSVVPDKSGGGAESPRAAPADSLARSERRL